MFTSRTRLICSRWEIQRFAKRYANAGPLEDALKRMSTLQELDQHLEMVHDKLTRLSIHRHVVVRVVKH